MNRPAILVLGPSGLGTAHRLAAVLGGAQIEGPETLLDEGTLRPFPVFADRLRALFAEGRAIVGLCAAGILIRVLAPLLGDKTAEPPVIAVAEDGSAVVPLLGGHHGANELARRLAVALDVPAAITTAGDLRLGTALDAPPPGWHLANPDDAKSFTSALLRGDPARIDPALDWLAGTGIRRDEAAALRLTATTRRRAGGTTELVYHPARLALGVGCERGCPAGDLIALAHTTLAEHDLAPAAIAAVVSLDLKADEAAVHALSADLGVPARFFDRQALLAQANRLANPSTIVAREVGVPGVAEAAALAAAGPEGRLLVEKTKGARATVAIAEAPAPLDAGALGRGRGRLALVGLGPGGRAWRSHEAETELIAATDWVGYGLYLDLATDLQAGKRLHRFPLGAEEERVCAALTLAGQGRKVALVCSGDPGIYAMASLVFELMDPDGSGANAPDGARRAEIVVIPGISAVQAAAARAGAMIGHDFCCISLSDLLTPWTAIEARLAAAAEGDFVVGLYNPRSMRRRDQMPRALAILGAHRLAETPVIVAHSLGRGDERIETTTLADLDPETVDMMSVVLVGATSTRTFTAGDGRRRTYTPRGYAAKRLAAASAAVEVSSP